MPAKPTDTSITDAAARRFIAGAAERDTLWCAKITGLHLIKLKKGGSWRFRYRNAAGKRRVATIGSFTELKPQAAAKKALAWRNENVDVLEAKERKRREAVRDEALAKHRTLRAYLEGPYERYQRRKKTGLETLAIIRHNFPAFMDRDMADLSRADIMEWQKGREAEGRAHSTLQRAFGALKTLLRHATRQDPPLLTENPLERVTLECPTDRERAEQLSAERAAARRLLTPAEVQGLHRGLEAFGDELRRQRRNSRKHGKPHLPDLDNVAHPHWFIPFAYCALYTGLRPGDLYSLTWLEMNMHFRRITKTPEKTRHHPAPAKIVMDIPPDLYAVMLDWWKQQGKPDSGLVFPSPVTGARMDKKAHLKPWARVKRLGELPPTLSFYALRHHFISTLVANGVPLLTVARLVGHKSTAMIDSHYGHLCPSAAADALAVFSKAVAKQAKEAAR